MFIGFTGHAFDSETEFAIKRETHNFNGYNFELASIFPQERPIILPGLPILSLETVKEDYNDISPEKRVYFHRDPNPR